MKNYIDLGKNLLGTWEHYVYLDTDEFMAASLLRRNQVRVKVENILGRDNEEYYLIAIRVRRKDREKFVRAMEELKGKMLLYGHRDYESHGGMLIEETREIIREDAAKNGKIELPTGRKIRTVIN